MVNKVASASEEQEMVPPCAPTLDMAYPPEDADGDDGGCHRWETART